MTSSLNNCKKLILSCRHITFALIATLPLVFSMPAYAQQNQIPTSDRGSSKVEYQGHSIDEMIYTFMAEKQIPGLSLAIVQAPYISRSVAYGISDLEQHRLASPNTVWNAGPISQGYAAVAVMQLYEQGKLDIREKLSKYVQGLPTAWADVTVFQLMQHATGIADYRNQPGYDAAKNYSSQDLINSVKDIPLAFTPGTDVAQSATNFLLLANAVETASGMSYSDFVTKNQIQFLGLKHTCFSQDISKLPMENVAANNNKHKEFKTKLQFIDPTENAVGYNANLTRVPLPNSAALKGFSDIFASAADISVWDIALAGSLLIKPEHHELIYRPTKLDNGKIVPAMAGWTFFHHKGLMDSKGTTAGFSAFICRFTDPSELVCVTLLANKEGIDFTNLARRIASAYGKSMSSGANDNNLYLLESAHSVEQTVARVQAELKKRNIQLFTIIDHGQNAKDAKLEMPPSQVLVFGSAAVGTPLMKINPSFSGELPLKIAVWQDASGSVWLSFPRMKELAAGYGLENDPSISAMQTLLESITQAAAAQY